jgi:hypothetical protein
MAAVPEGVAMGARRAVVLRVRDGNARADGVARAQERPEVGVE